MKSKIVAAGSVHQLSRTREWSMGKHTKVFVYQG